MTIQRDDNLLDNPETNGQKADFERSVYLGADDEDQPSLLEKVWMEVQDEIDEEERNPQQVNENIENA